MIDIHCHILPGVDDGAENMNEARLMSAMAADDGVTEIVATPHITYGTMQLPLLLKRIDQAAEELSFQLDSAGIPIKLHVGAEVLCCGSVPEVVDAAIFPRLAGGSFSLVEFMFDESGDYMTEWLKRITDAKIKPIVAHPERYAAVGRDKRLTEIWVEMGCLLQLNRGSLDGRFGWTAKRTAHRIMKDGHASFLASDAHDSYRRTTRLGNIIPKLAKQYGEEYVNALTQQNPQMLFV